MSLIVKAVRRYLHDCQINGSSRILRQTLSGQHRASASSRHADANAQHIRKATRANLASWYLSGFKC